jgi:hypothetical protein
MATVSGKWGCPNGAQSFSKLPHPKSKYRLENITQPNRHTITAAPMEQKRHRLLPLTPRNHCLSVKTLYKLLPKVPSRLLRPHPLRIKLYCTATRSSIPLPSTRPLPTGISLDRHLQGIQSNAQQPPPLTKLPVHSPHKAAIRAVLKRCVTASGLMVRIPYCI